MRPIVHCLLSLICLVTIAASAQAADTLRIERGEPVVPRRTFDPKNRPSDMPQLNKGEAAVTYASYGVSSEMSVKILRDERVGSEFRSTVQVEWVKVSTSLNITIWLPTNAWAGLKEHEEAHRRLSERYYEQADSIARELAGRYLNRKLTGKGRDVEAARNDAINQAVRKLNADFLARTQTPAERVNDLFDQITDHGRKRIPSEEGMKQAIARHEREQGQQ